MRKGVICVCRYVLTLYLYLFSYFLHRHNQALIERETAPRRVTCLSFILHLTSEIKYNNNEIEFVLLSFIYPYAINNYNSVDLT